MKNYKLRQFNNLDKWMAAGEAESKKIDLYFSKRGPVWVFKDKNGGVVGQIFVGETFTGKPQGWMTILIEQKSA